MLSHRAPHRDRSQKIAGLTLEGYLADNFNRFDCVIVIISLIELSVQSGGGVSALRTFRLMRVFKLARGWTGFNLLLQRMVSAIPRIGPLTLVLGIIMLMYSLIGMQFFGGTLRDSDGDVPRANYDTLFWAFVTTFQIITGENWNEVCVRGFECACVELNGGLTVTICSRRSCMTL